MVPVLFVFNQFYSLQRLQQVIYYYFMQNYSNSARVRRNSETLAPSDCSQQHFYLTERGLNQALRNRSDQIWWTMGSNPVGYAPCYVSHSHRQRKAPENHAINNQNAYTIERPDKSRQQNKQENARSLQKQTRSKNVSFSLPEDSFQDSAGKRKQKKNESTNSNTNTNTSGNPNIFKQSPGRVYKSKQKKKLTKEEQEKRQIFLKECYSIDQYLKTNKAYTREMPNSAIKLFYEAPCIEAYGRKNTSGNNGFIYNDFMKTHNVLPHRLGNQPVKYQSYRSALNFCKRTKIDPEERWKKIHRQMRKKLNMKELVEYYAQGFIDVDAQTIQDALKLNINTIEGIKFQRSKSFSHLSHVPISQKLDLTTVSAKQDLNTTKATSDMKENSSDRISELKRSKSWGKKEHLFLYKYKNKHGEVQYCKDRHGITCYVDPSFEENKEAYTKFLRRIKPLEMEDVSPSDRNIDQQLLNNFVLTQQQEIPQHYMLPNCDEPERYKPEKYSIKARKRSNASEIKTAA